MAWSECFNGKMGPVKDCYHLVSLSITISDIDLHPHDMVDKLIRLAGFASETLHLIIDLQLHTVSEQAALNLFADFRNEFSHKWKMSMRSSILQNCVVTVLFDARVAEEALEILFPPPSTTVELLQINFLIISCQLTFPSTVEYVHNVFDLVKGRAKLGMTLPENDNHKYILQRILESIRPDALHILYFGSLSSPSLLNLRKVDFIHSRGLNVMATIPESYLSDLSIPDSAVNSPLLTSLARKYNKFEVAMLARGLIQFGFIVGVGVNGGTPDEHICERFLFISHPFIYRKEFVSPTNIMSFTIGADDMESLRDASEAIESIWDEELVPFATERAAIIPKTDSVFVSGRISNHQQLGGH